MVEGGGAGHRAEADVVVTDMNRPKVYAYIIFLRAI